MNNKLLFTDTETTGLDPKKNDIIQVSGIIVIDNVVQEEFDFRCQPFNYNSIRPEAVATHGITVEKMRTFEQPVAVYRKIHAVLEKYINRYDKKDKFIAVGQKIQFDLDMLRCFFEKNGDTWFGSYVDRRAIDVLTFTQALRVKGLLKTETLKLEDVTKALGIDIGEAHNSLADIRATKAVFDKFMSMITMPVQAA